jgi:hypothetical protein
MDVSKIEVKALSFKSRDSSVGIAMGYGQEGRLSNLGGGKFLLFSIAPRPALGLTQPPIQWVPEALSGPGVKLISRLYLVPSSRMMELYLHSPICLHGIVLN